MSQQNDYASKLKTAEVSVSKSAPLAVVGTVAVDSVETPFGKKDSVFGGSASYFAYAASNFTPVSLAAVVGEDFPQEYRDILSERAIEMSHLETIPGKTFHWSGKYEGDMNAAITLDTQLNVLLEFDPKISYSNTPEFLFLANVDPTLQGKVLDQLEKPKIKFVALDTMNFWIENKNKELLDVLARIDCIVLNDGEARQLTGETNLIRAAQKVREMGPDHVVVKKGEHGSLVFFKEKFFALPAYPLENVYDPTGAGDTFAGGMMGYLTQAGEVTFENFKRAVAYGTVTASHTVEDFGLEALRRTSKEDLDQRLEAFRAISTF